MEADGAAHSLIVTGLSQGSAATGEAIGDVCGEGLATLAGVPSWASCCCQKSEQFWRQRGSYWSTFQVPATEAKMMTFTVYGVCDTTEDIDACASLRPESLV